MSAARLPKVAGIDPPIPAPAHTASPTVEQQCPPGDPNAHSGTPDPAERLAAAQDRLASWVSDLTTLHELTERLAGTATLQDALRELLRAGGTLVGARRGLAAVSPSTGWVRPPSSASVSDRPNSACWRPSRCPRHPGRCPRRRSTPTCAASPGSAGATARSPCASASAPATACACPPSPPAGWARPCGSTTNPPSPPSAGATSSACTAATPPSISPGCSSSTEAAPPSPRSASCCRPACRGSPGSGWRCGTARPPGAAATGTTPSRCPRGRWGCRSAG